MTITILNGNPDSSNQSFDEKAKELGNMLKLKGVRINYFDLKEYSISSCTGCWGCWVKTPGECLFEDDSKLIREAVINSDKVIFMSPLIMGFTSALLKITQDKFIPLVHPYIELVNNECHHEKRYPNYPRMGLIYAPEPETDQEDLQIVSEVYKRFSLNFKSELTLFKSINESLEDLSHEIMHR